jgi:hypothetical protein
VDSSGSVQGLVAGCCDHDNEPSGSIRGGQSFHQPSNYVAIEVKII